MSFQFKDDFQKIVMLFVLHLLIFAYLLITIVGYYYGVIAIAIFIAIDVVIVNVTLIMSSSSSISVANH